MVVTSAARIDRTHALPPRLKCEGVVLSEHRTLRTNFGQCLRDTLLHQVSLRVRPIVHHGLHRLQPLFGDAGLENSVEVGKWEQAIA